ncbi:EAL domain-containing protein [Streptosporangiaceae bacterium NEAU-GS5]|nr:EAL domain-containing protein [Streptosporangiaceae bacterium NEAU-GS5]
MSAPDAPLPAAFHPIVDLDTGGVIAVEVTAHPHAGPRHSLTGTIEALRSVSAEGALLPLVLTIPVGAVAGGSAALAPLHEAMRVATRRPREVILAIEGAVAPGDRSALLHGVDGLRAAGYLIAFGEAGSSHLPLDLIADAQPYVVMLAPELVERAPRDARRAAVAESVVTFAREIAAHVLAPGVVDESQLAAVRGWGIRLAQGSLLAPGDWKPSHGRVNVPLPATENVPPLTALLGPRVQEFLMPAVTLSMNATAEGVVAAFGTEPSITSIILVDEFQRPHGSIDRSRFLLFMAGAYGHALHAKKPATRLADPPKVVPKTTPAVAAMQLTGRDPSRVYDDLVVVDELGRCMGVVHVSDLIRHVVTSRH